MPPDESAAAMWRGSLAKRLGDVPNVKPGFFGKARPQGAVLILDAQATPSAAGSR